MRVNKYVYGNTVMRLQRCTCTICKRRDQEWVCVQGQHFDLMTLYYIISVIVNIGSKSHDIVHK